MISLHTCITTILKYYYTCICILCLYNVCTYIYKVSDDFTRHSHFLSKKKNKTVRVPLTSRRKL